MQIVDFLPHQSFLSDWKTVATILANVLIVLLHSDHEPNLKALWALHKPLPQDFKPTFSGSLCKSVS